jgi:hypothetical protein
MRRRQAEEELGGEALPLRKYRPTVAASPQNRGIPVLIHAARP